MKEVFVVSDNVLSPLGSTSVENFDQLKNAVSGIKLHENHFSPLPFYASLFDNNALALSGSTIYTKFENLIIASVKDASAQSDIDITDKNTILIISSTKGNISLLETEEQNNKLTERISLPASAKLIAEYFKLANTPLIVSHACISGVLAIITAMRLLRAGLYDNAIVTGADIISKFVLSGFQSFQAISNEPCKPFDADRKGITLGEAAGTLILSTNKQDSKTGIKICSGAVSNDANHISGPSRTGEELGTAIIKTIADANITTADIDFISAHGTATMYNDEMEAKAFTLAQMNSIPVNSLKGYYGHTLGAAGLIETVVSINSLKENILIPTLGYSKHGVSTPLNVSNTVQKGSYNCFLKTASGFGGCNAAIVVTK